MNAVTITNVEETADENLEQRTEWRRSTDAMVTCRPYASHGDTPQIDGVMHNVSLGGAYIEADSPFQPGTILVLRLVRYASVQAAPKEVEGLRWIALVEVRWCREREAAVGLQYEMGVRYFN